MGDFACFAAWSTASEETVGEGTIDNSTQLPLEPHVSIVQETSCKRQWLSITPPLEAILLKRRDDLVENKPRA